MTKIVNMRHLAVIVSVVIMAIGMAVGTICHFVSNGFFNYGDEFASYKSVEVTTSIPEDINGNIARQIASDELSWLNPYEVSFSAGTGTAPNTVIYKFSLSVSDSDLESAVSTIQERLASNGMEDGSVSAHLNEGVPEGLYQLSFAAIALASAVVFQAIYFAIRLKPGMALSAICSQLTTVGVYASLLAITRCSVGLEAIAFAALAVIVTMVCNGIFFGNLKRAFKDEANAKVDKYKLVADSAASTVKLNAFICIAAAAMVVIFAIFAMIASATFATLMPYISCLLAIAACAYVFCIFAPANYAMFCGLDRKRKK